MAGVYAINMVAGEDLNLSFVRKTKNDDGSATVIDMTGFSSELKIIDPVTGTVFIDITDTEAVVGVGTLTVDGPNGALIINVPHAGIEAAFNSANYRLFIIDTTGSKTALLYGQVNQTGLT
jgi:hypothetical protein